MRSGDEEGAAGPNTLLPFTPPEVPQPSNSWLPYRLRRSVSSCFSMKQRPMSLGFSTAGRIMNGDSAWLCTLKISSRSTVSRLRKEEQQLQRSHWALPPIHRGKPGRNIRSARAGCTVTFVGVDVPVREHKFSVARLRAVIARVCRARRRSGRFKQLLLFLLPSAAPLPPPPFLLLLLLLRLRRLLPQRRLRLCLRR